MITLQEIKQKLNSQLSKDIKAYKEIESKLNHIRKAKTRRFREGEHFIIVNGNLESKFQGSDIESREALYDERAKLQDFIYEAKEANNKFQEIKNTLSHQRGGRFNAYWDIISYALKGNSDWWSELDDMRDQNERIESIRPYVELWKSQQDANKDSPIDFLQERLEEVYSNAWGRGKDLYIKSGNMELAKKLRRQFMLKIKPSSNKSYAGDIIRAHQRYNVDLDTLAMLQVKANNKEFLKEINEYKGAQDA